MPSAAEFLDAADEVAPPQSAESFLSEAPASTASAESFLSESIPATPVPPIENPPAEITPPPTAAALGLPAGLDPNITGGAQMRATPTIVDKLRQRHFGDAFEMGYEKLRRQVSGLIGPTEAERVENSVQWGTDENGNPKFEYKPLGDRLAREQGLLTPFLKVEPMKRELDDTLAQAAGKAVFNTASGLTGSLLSPGTIITGAAGSAVPAAGKVIGGAFSVDMAHAFKQSVKQALAATDPQSKIEGWLSAISSLGFAAAGGAHVAGVDATGRPLAGGKNVNAQGEAIAPRAIPGVVPAQVHAAGAPETAAAVDEANKAAQFDEGSREGPPAPPPEPEQFGPAAPTADQLYQMHLEERLASQGRIKEPGAPPPVEVVNPETGKVETPVKINPLEELQKVEPETQTTLDPELYPPVQRSIADLKLSKEVPNFKGDADPETGVVEGESLQGRYEHLGSGSLIVWERNDGSREVVSGRHRFDLAKRTGTPIVSQQTLKESDGWTAQRVARVDAELNIRDGQGTTADYANYFRNSEGSKTDAEAGGLLARAKGRAGYTIGKNASDDLFALYQAKELSEPHALAIVEAAGTDAGAQKVGIRYSRSNPRASSQDIANRVRAATLVDTSKEVLDQGELWDSGDQTMQAMDKAAKAASDFQKEKQSDVKTLTAALGKSDELKLTKNEAKKFKVSDPNSVLEIRKALERARAEAAGWDNWHLDSSKTAAVLQRSGTAKEFAKNGPSREEASSWAAAVGTKFDDVNDAGDYQFTIKDPGHESTIHIPARNVTKESIAKAVEAKRAEIKAEPSAKFGESSEADLDAFFAQMGIEPLPKAEAAKPAERLKAADVVEAPLDPSIVEVPPGAERVYKAKIGGTTGTVVEYPDRLEVKDLTSLQQGQGGGSAVLESLKAKGKPIELTAGKRSTDTPAAQLGQFYRNRGFTETEPGRFRWEPEKPVASAKAPTAKEFIESPEPDSVTVYHGSAEVARRGGLDQLRLDISPAGNAREVGASIDSMGTWWTADKGDAAKFGKSGDKPGAVVTGQIKLQNPKVFSSTEEAHAYFNKFRVKDGMGGRSAPRGDAIIADLRQQGHDGIIIKGGEPGIAEHDYYLSFENKGVKVKGTELPGQAAEDLPQAAGASNINELVTKQSTFAADVYAGLEAAKGEPPTREEWELQFLRNYPHLEGDTLAIDRAWTLAQEAAARFKESGGRKPMPAIVGELMGEIRGSGVTGIKNAQADVVRRQFGLPAAIAAARRSLASVWDAAMRYIDDNPQAQDALIQRLKDEPHSTVTDFETAMLLQRQIDLETQHARAIDAVNKAYEQDNETARTQALASARLTQDALIDLLDINKRVGSEQGRSLAARKMLGRRDYSLERMLQEERASKGGEDLTEAERTKVEKDHADIERTDSEFEAAIEKADEDTAKTAADTEIENLKEKAKTEDAEYEPLVASIAERIYNRLKKSADEARARIRARLGNVSTTPFDVGIVKDLAILAAEAVARGIRRFSEWRTEMLKEWGDKVDPHLQKAWDEGDKIVERSVAAAAPRKKRTKVSGAVRKLDPEQVRERAKESLKTKSEAEGFDASNPKDLKKLRPLVSKIALSFVRNGLAEREALVDAVHSIVSEIVPEITRRQTMDLISGYGDFSELDMEAAKVQLRDIQGQLQQSAKLADILAKRPLEKSGRERRQKSDTERRMEAEVNEAKRRVGVVTTDSNRQLKSSLDAIHTRLSNQIKDIADEIETGRTRTGKTKVEYDERADNLKAVRDRLQKTLDDITEKPGVTDEQRLKAATRAAEESLREYERRIREKDFSSEKPSELPPNAQLDALKRQRDAKKAEFEELRALDEAYQEEKQFDSLMKQGDDIAAKLASGKVAPEAPGPKAPDTDLVAAARERLNGLRKNLRDARNATPEAREAKVKAAAESLQKSIEEYDARLKSGAIDPVTRKPAVDTPELQRLRAERDALKQYVTDLRNAKRPKLSRDEIGIKSLKTRLLNENADLLDRMARGDFAKKPVVKLDISKDPDAVRLKAENTRIKQEFEKRKLINEKEARTKWEKRRDAIVQAALLPRALKSSFDVSAVLRQGGVIGFGNPARAKVAMAEMFAGLKSETLFRDNQARIESHPLYEEAKASNLFLADTGDVRLSAREEAFLSELSDNIPGVRASNRAYISYLNRLRMDSYAAMRESLVGGGFLRRRGTATPAELKAIANYVNVATGRGVLPGHMAQAAQTLASVFFSPRLLASRFQLLAGQPLYGGSLRTRVLIAREYAKSLTGLAVVLALGTLAGGTVEKDWRSSDFGKLRFGNTRIDFLSGLSQVTALVGKLSTGEKLTGSGKIRPIRATEERPLKYGEDDAADLALRFGRSKFAPIPSAILNALAGRNINGDPTDWKKEALELFLPLSFGDVASVMRDQGVPEGTIISILALFGASVQSYEDKRAKAQKRYLDH